MSTAEKATEFLQRLFNQMERPGGGKVAVDSDVVQRMVREDPESATAVVHGYCQIALDQKKPELFQLAATLAAAYQIEFDDDSLVRHVEEAMESCPSDVPPIGIVPLKS